MLDASRIYRKVSIKVASILSIVIQKRRKKPRKKQDYYDSPASSH